MAQFGVILALKSSEEWVEARTWQEAVKQVKEEFSKAYPDIEIEGADQVIDEDGEDIVWEGIEQ